MKVLEEGDPGHTAVTDEQRLEELKAREGYKAQAEKAGSVKGEAQEEVERIQLAVLERLMRAEATQTFNMVFRDEEGDFAIPIRIMRSEERKACVQLIMGLGISGAEASAGQDEGLTKVDDSLEALKVFAAGLVTDEDIAKGILEGKLSDKMALEIVKFSLERTIAMEETGVSFRLN